MRRLLARAVGHRFSDADPAQTVSVGQLFAFLQSSDLYRTIARREALSVPAVLRGRNLICSIATLPLVQIDARQRLVTNPLLKQIDPDVANVVTLAQTLEDLLFDAISWWVVTDQDPQGYPIHARHVDVSAVSLTPPVTARSLAPLPSGWDPREAAIWVDGKPVPASRVIRFDSPNPPLAYAGARAIRRALLLDLTAKMYAEDPRPLDYFAPADDAPDPEPETVTEVLDKWRAARRERATAFVPSWLKYNSVDAPSPQEMQLAEMQKQAALDLANAIGVDPEELGVSTTSRTYFNAIDRRQSRVNDVLAPYIQALTDRLSMGDVTRRGHVVTLDLTAYMRADPATRTAYYTAMHALDAMTPEEIREAEGLGPMPAQNTPALPAEPDSTPPADELPSGDPTGLDAELQAMLTFSRRGGKRVPRSVRLARPDVEPEPEPTSATFTVPVTRAFAVNRSARTVEGIVLPYGVDQVADTWFTSYRFEPGSLRHTEDSRVKLLRDHDVRQPLGKLIFSEDRPEGRFARYYVARGAAGDEALSLAEDGVLDGFSVGVDFDFASDTIPDPENEGVTLVRRAYWRETSLTPMPAFDDARVSKVAASRNRNGVSKVDECATCGQRHAPGVACPTTETSNTNGDNGAQASVPAAVVNLSADQRRALLENSGVVDQLLGQMLRPENGRQEQRQEQRAQLSAEQITALMSRPGGAQIVGALLGVQVPAAQPEQPAQPAGERRQTVDPTRRTGALSASVQEPPSYVFDRKGTLRPAAHDFGVDLIQAAKSRREDDPAYRRAMEFVRAQFADVPIATGDVNDLNPTINVNRFIDERDFQYPLFNAINRGAPPNGVQPFAWPKFGTAGTLVDDHVEGTEPDAGGYTTGSQTVTPAPLSGKAKINREVWDMGGVPGLSDLLWRKVTRSWYETIESKIVALLTAQAAGMTALGALTVGNADTGQTLTSELTGYMAMLQFVRGGFRFDTAFAQADLYGALTGAQDGNARPLFPVLGAQNATGQTADRFAQVNIGGVPFLPAWALAAAGQTAPTNSYLIDRTAVDAWVTPPERIDLMNIAVAYVEVGIWGYHAEAVNDLAGTRKIVWDPSAL